MDWNEVRNEDLRDDALNALMAEREEAEMDAMADWTADMREWELAVIGR